MAARRVLVLSGIVVLSACGTGVFTRAASAPGPAVAAPDVAATPEGDSVASSSPVSEGSLTPVVPTAAAEIPVDTGPLPPAWDIDVGPYETHARVEYFIERFRGPIKATFELALERQSRYAPMIHERLRAGGLPDDMIFLPLIESWYDPHAYSVAAAVGMWQFMTATAKGVGLRVDWWIDERRDPVRSTDGAVRYLNELRGSFGSTYLAAAAYNGGPGRIARGLLAHSATLEGSVGDDLFFALSDNTGALRAETRDYVPKLIAAALVGKDPGRHGVEARTVLPFTWDSVSVPPATPLAAVAKAAGVPLDTVLDYNPQVLRGMTPPSGAPVWLRLPVGSTDGFAAALAALPEAERTAFRRVVTKEADFITRIARANGLTAQQLNWYNPQATRQANGNLHAGQRILVPRADVVRAARDVPNPAIERYGASNFYVVKRGEHLSLIARKHGTTVARLKQLNRLQSDVIRIGQRLRVR
ncbi:MAG: transglycosylase SLT domain-containing protein [Gemmatimonadaceae bacterium]